MRERFWLPTRERFRRGGRADAPFVRQLAGEVFAYLGDYSSVLPTWLQHDGVSTQILERAGQPLGFTMLGVYARDQLDGPTLRRRAPANDQAEFVADLLAIAVDPAEQGHGLGRRLLEDAIARARRMRRRLRLRELRLSVADVNVRARRLFDTLGFRHVIGEDSLYDGGQVALHLRLPLD